MERLLRLSVVLVLWFPFLWVNVLALTQNDIEKSVFHNLQGGGLGAVSLLPPMRANLRFCWALAGALLLATPLSESATNPMSVVLARLEVIDIERILTNDRIITKYLRCMLRQGVCPPEARDFRRSFPGILRRLCDSCTERQRSNLKQIFSFVKTKFPSEWGKILKIYDPKNETIEKLEEFIKS